MTIPMTAPKSAMITDSERITRADLPALHADRPQQTESRGVRSNTDSIRVLTNADQRDDHGEREGGHRRVRPAR